MAKVIKRKLSDKFSFRMEIPIGHEIFNVTYPEVQDVSGLCDFARYVAEENSQGRKPDITIEQVGTDGKLRSRHHIIGLHSPVWSWGDDGPSIKTDPLEFDHLVLVNRKKGRSSDR